MQSHPRACIAHGADEQRERAAILAVIARETSAYYAEDFDAWRATYVQAPYFRLHGYWDGFAQPVVSYVGFDTLAAVKRAQFAGHSTYWPGSSEVRRNLNVRIHPGVAWVTFDQDSYEQGTGRPLGRSIETRILEKHDGQWRIAYLGYLYLPRGVGGGE